MSTILRKHLPTRTNRPVSPASIQRHRTESPFGENELSRRPSSHSLCNDQHTDCFVTRFAPNALSRCHRPASRRYVSCARQWNWKMQSICLYRALERNARARLTGSTRPTEALLYISPTASSANARQGALRRPTAAPLCAWCRGKGTLHAARVTGSRRIRHGNMFTDRNHIRPLFNPSLCRLVRARTSASGFRTGTSGRYNRYLTCRDRRRLSWASCRRLCSRMPTTSM